MRIIIPPSKKSGYIGVTVSVGSHILSGLFLTNHWVEFYKILHEASIPRGKFNVHIYLLSYGVGQSAVYIGGIYHLQ